MNDFEICTNCKQSIEVSFSDRSYGSKCENYLHCQCFKNTFDENEYQNDKYLPNDCLQIPAKTIEFTDKDGCKIEIVQKGYIFESIKKMNKSGRLIYEKLFTGFYESPSIQRDYRNYINREYYEDGSLKYESYRVSNFNKFREEYRYPQGITKEWYPNGVLKSEEDWKVYEKKWDIDGYLLVHNQNGHSNKNLKNIKKRWYKDIDMCLDMSDCKEFIGYHIENQEITYVVDRLGNKYKGVFDKLENLAPYTINKESNTNEYRILNEKYDNLYKKWIDNGILTRDIFYKYPSVCGWNYELIQLNGNFKIYNLKGILVEEVTYENNLLNGIYRKKDWESGLLIKEYNFQKHKLNGLCREWSNSGILLKEHNYIKNKFTGLCREWSGEGILLKEHNYKDHKLEGFCNEFDESGNLLKNGSFTNGKCIDENGKKIMIKKMDVIIFL